MAQPEVHRAVLHELGPDAEAAILCSNAMAILGHRTAGMSAYSTFQSRPRT